MERTQHKQEINMTEALMSRINELISHYPEDKENQLYYLYYTRFKMHMTIG
jgi:hypothetical protein